MDQTEFRIGNAVASLEMEGYNVTPEQIALARRCLNKEITYDEAVDSIIRRYRALDEQP